MRKVLLSALILLAVVNAGYVSAEGTQLMDVVSADLLGIWQAAEDDPEGIGELTFLPDGTMRALAGGNAMTPVPFLAQGGLLIALMGEEIMAINVGLADEETLLFDGSEFVRTRVNAGEMALDNSLIGTWASEDTDGLTYRFQRDGNYVAQLNGVDAYGGAYLAAADVLLYSESNVVFHRYNYRLNMDGTLQFEEDGEKVLSFRLIDAAEPLPVRTLWEQLMGSWHSTSNGGDMTFTYRPDGVMAVSNADEVPSEFAYCVRGEYQASVLAGEIVVSKTSVAGDVMRMEGFTFNRVLEGEGALCLENELLGTWQNDEGIGGIEFGQDGNTRCQGIESSYAIAEPGKLLLLFDQGFANLNDYSIDDNVLTLTIEGNTVAFTKEDI